MLKLTSRFVLQVLPYLFVALAAVVLLAGIADLLIGPSRGRFVTAPRDRDDD